MAPRSSEIPHATKRSALQKLIVAGPLPFFKLRPAGKRTVSMMQKKGWIAMDGQKIHDNGSGRGGVQSENSV